MSDDKKSDARVFTPPFRVSYPYVFQPAPPNKDNPTAPRKYRVMAIWTPKEFSPEDLDLFKGMLRIANEASIKKFGKPLNELPGNFKKPFHKGDEKAEQGWTAENIFANISSEFKPGIVASDGKTPVLDAQGFYAGCYARASVNAYGYDRGGGKGVSLGLQNLMFVKHGERLDNRIEAAADFEAFAGKGGDDLGLDDLGLSELGL